jgi:hypothetical protein
LGWDSFRSIGHSGESGNQIVAAHRAFWQKDVKNEGRPDYVSENKGLTGIENDRSDYVYENKCLSSFS